MNVKELLEKNRALLAENESLRKENKILRAGLGRVVKRRLVPRQDLDSDLPLAVAAQGLQEIHPHMELKSQPDPAEKIRLFMSLFKGWDDVYAKRWQSRDGRFGYAPVCLNEWKSGLCRKAAVKCFDCSHRTYDALNEKVIEAHLQGSIIVGIYPLYRDDMKRLTAFRNPEFYKAQALRLPTYDKPKILSWHTFF